MPDPQVNLTVFIHINHPLYGLFWVGYNVFWGGEVLTLAAVIVGVDLTNSYVAAGNNPVLILVETNCPILKLALCVDRGANLILLSNS